jgi:hypothetical protein
MIVQFGPYGVSFFHLAQDLYLYIWNRGINSCQICLTNHDNSVLAAPPSVQHSWRSSRIPGSYRIRSSPREHAGWSVPSLDQQLAVPPYMYAHLHTGLACESSVSLHRLLPSDLSAGKSEWATSLHCLSRSFGRWFLPRVPMPFPIKRAVDIH